MRQSKPKEVVRKEILKIKVEINKGFSSKMIALINVLFKK